MSLVSNSGLLTKIYFPRIILPAAAALGGLVDFLIGSLLLIGFIVYYDIPLGWHLLLWPVLVLPLVLLSFGLKPGATTSPSVVRTALNDLYRFEIRSLRDRCRAGEFTTRELPAHVVELRKRYLLLSIPVERWFVMP